MSLSWWDNRRLTAFLLAGFVAALPIPHTIALRHALLLLLLAAVAAGQPDWRSLGRGAWPLFLWAGYLAAFPLLAETPGAVGDAMPPWIVGLLVLLAGAGAGQRLGDGQALDCFKLGAISSFPLILHLALALGLWLGLVPLGFGAWGHDLPAALRNGDFGSLAAFPWGYWGIELHHADLGYAALQSLVLLAAAAFAGRERRQRPIATLAAILALAVACLSSLLVARGRAGLVFALAAALATPLLALACSRPAGKPLPLRKALLGGLALAATALLGAAHTDSRWEAMGTRLLHGFYGDPVTLFCAGPEAFAEQLRREKPELPAAAIAEIAAQAADGDGARIQLLRLGVRLVLDHPLGIDGSKQAFQTALKQRCDHPAIVMAHAHNGWLDTFLALGWAGGFLYLAVLVFFLRAGWRHLRSHGQANEWALVLTALSALWIVRGLVDSVYRDHMLQMQAVVLAFAWARLRAGNPAA